MDQDNRVVVLIDMDCFYCQVEEKLNLELKGKPIAVVQYNPWKGGGIIAVNYVARAMGVTRHMRGVEAKEKCPQIELPSVPCQRGKADITKYRDAGKEVARVLQKFTPLLERASIDEAYLDITAPVQQRLNTLDANTITTDVIPNTYALGYECVDEFLADVHTCGMDNIDFDFEHAKRLLVGAVIVSEIRAAVYEETGFRCSAGISHNKILAKLVCGMNKPNKQTVLPKHSINILYNTLSIKKVKHLGGKFGDTVCDVLKVSKMGELQKFSEKELQSRIDEKNGTWLYNIARGIDLEPVQARFNPKSIGCCKQLRGKAALVDLESLRKWLKDLGDEIEDRLENDALENNRTPKQMVVSYSTQLKDGRDTSSSRSYNFVADDELCGELISNKALELLIDSSEGVKVKGGESNRRLKAPIKFLGISVGKFEDNTESKKTMKILDFFDSSKNVAAKLKGNKENNDTGTVDKKKTNVKPSGKDYIMQKFLHTSVKGSDTRTLNNTEVKKDAVLESSLDKQESFFAKMLNGNNNRGFPQHMELEKQTIRPTTPVCDIVHCGEDSNDTEYSGSTINMEINKSIALFEEDPQDITRVRNIRELLNTSKVNNKDSDSESILEPEQSTNIATEVTPQVGTPTKKETFECSECGKLIAIDMVAEHSDYHLALMLREEERQQVRKEIIEKNENKVHCENTGKGSKRKAAEEQCNIKNETVSSIAHFLLKIDDNVPTEVCSECSKKIPLEKFGEHLDYHEAKKLSRELNRKTSPLFSGSSVKRKRKNASPVKKNKVPCRPIDSFFR